MAPKRTTWMGVEYGSVCTWLGCLVNGDREAVERAGTQQYEPIPLLIESSGHGTTSS